MLSALNQRFSFVAEIAKKYNWARAQQRAEPHVSVWQLVLPLTQFWPVTASTAPDNARHRSHTVHSGRLGMTKCSEKAQTPRCEPGWATQPQHLRPIPGPGRFPVAVLTNEGLGFQVLLLQHTNSV